MIGWLRRLLPLLIGGGARLVADCIGLAATTVAARALGPSEWGVWVVLFAGFGWSQHLAEWGLRSIGLVLGGQVGGIGRGLLGDLARARSIVLSLAMVGLMVGVRFWRPDLAVASIWLAGALVAIAVNLDWVALVQGRPWLPGATLILRPILSLTVLLVLPGPLTISGQALAVFVGFAAAAVLAASQFGRLDPDPPDRVPIGAAPLLKSGTPYFLVTAANQLAASADLIAVAWIMGAKAAGTFGLVATIAQTATLGAQASAQWWLARSTRADAPPLRRIMIETGCLGGLVGVTLMVLGPTLTLLLFGNEWTQAAALLPLAGLFVALAHVTAVLGSIHCARGGAAAVATVQLVTQAAAWPLQLLAVMQFGLVGVVLSRGLIELLRLVMLGLLCRHRAVPASET